MTRRTGKVRFTLGLPGGLITDVASRVSRMGQDVMAGLPLWSSRGPGMRATRGLLARGTRCTATTKGSEGVFESTPPMMVRRPEYG